MTNSKSYIGLMITLLITGYLIIFFTIGWDKSLLQRGDQWGYNSYLVSCFIYGDTKDLSKTYEARSNQYHLAAKPAFTKNKIEEAPDSQNGNRVLKYYYGVAAMQAPFFLITHLLYQGNGYSPPYVLAIYISSMIYVLLGLLLLLNLLTKFFSKKNAVFTLTVVFFCSNLLYFTVCNPGLSHPYLFFLFAGLACVTYQFYRAPSTFSAIIIGFLMGLIIVIRVTDIVVIAIPLLFGLLQKADTEARKKFFQQHYLKIAAALAVCIVVTLPQLFYWKSVSGYWLYDTYPGEGFDFLHPHILSGLLSFKNGWLSYTPIMIIPLFFLPKMIKVRNPFAIGIILFLLVHIFITYSWKEWYYNAGLGSRPMVETYALLAIPLATGIENIFQHKLLKYLTVLFLAGCCYLNILRTFQMQTGNFISEDANWQFNKQMLFKFHTEAEDIFAFDVNEPQPDTGKIRFVSSLGVQDFESASENLKDSIVKRQGNRSAFFTKGKEFNDMVKANIPANFAKGDYIRISFWARVAAKLNHYRMGRMVMQIERNGHLIQWNSVRIHNKFLTTEGNSSLFGGAVNEWQKISFFIQPEKQILPEDELKVYGWNPYNADFWIDDLQVDHFKKR